jgi:hypothetical protein
MGRFVRHARVARRSDGSEGLLSVQLVQPQYCRGWSRNNSLASSVSSQNMHRTAHSNFGGNFLPRRAVNVSPNQAATHA